jgi:hypothetical protein
LRKLKVLVAVLAMVLLTASPAMAQPIEFVDGGVLVIVEGTGNLQQAPITGVFAVPDLGAGTVAGGNTFATGFPEFGAFSEAGQSTFAGGIQGLGPAVQADDLCLDTTGLGVCP